MMPQKLPFPDWLLVTPCEVVINREGLDEDGAPMIAAQWAGKVIYSEKAKTVITADKQLVRIEGSIIAKGDIAPGVPTASAGTVTIDGAKEYRVYRMERPRNPDGTIHHTTLELM